MSRDTQSSRRLTTTSYALLAQLALKPWSTYELAEQRVRYFRFVWPRAESAIYREAKRLANAGLADTSTERTGKRKRTIYTITDDGIDALRDWLQTPVSPFAMDFEAMIRLFIAPLGTTGQLISTLEQVRADAQEMLAFGGEVKLEFLEGRGVLQDQAYIRALAVDFFINFLRTVESWVERTIQEVLKWDDMTLEEKNLRGLEIFASVPVQTPESSSSDTPKAPITQHRSRR
jgi:DNA-binding PadR family transcriptional regulator